MNLSGYLLGATDLRDFSTQEVNKLLQRRPQRFVVTPSGERVEDVGATIAQGLDGGEQQSRVAGY